MMPADQKLRKKNQLRKAPPAVSMVQLRLREGTTYMSVKLKAYNILEKIGRETWRKRHEIKLPMLGVRRNEVHVHEE